MGCSLLGNLLLAALAVESDFRSLRVALQRRAFGGIVTLGFGLGNVITFFTSFDVKVPLQWAVIGLVFCSTVGIAFGLLPAIRASRLHPIDALRYE